MRRFIFLFLVLFFPMLMFAQTSHLSVKMGYMNNMYFYDGEQIENDIADSLLFFNQAANEVYLKSRSQKILQTSFSAVGIFCVTMPIIYLSISDSWNDLSDNMAFVGVAGLGACLLVATIPLNCLAKKNLNKSIDLYNSAPLDYQKPKGDVYLGMSGNSIGVGFKF